MMRLPKNISFVVFQNPAYGSWISALAKGDQDFRRQKKNNSIINTCNNNDYLAYALLKTL